MYNIRKTLHPLWASIYLKNQKCFRNDACLTKPKCLIKVSELFVPQFINLFHIRFYHTRTQVFDIQYRQAASFFKNNVIYNISDDFHVCYLGKLNCSVLAWSTPADWIFYRMLHVFTSSGKNFHVCDLKELLLIVNFHHHICQIYPLLIHVINLQIVRWHQK